MLTIGILEGIWTIKFIKYICVYNVDMSNLILLSFDLWRQRETHLARLRTPTISCHKKIIELFPTVNIEIAESPVEDLKNI